MRTELENELIKSFPFMERKNTLEEQEKSGKIYDLYGAFGCAVGDGWFALLFDMCKELAELYANENSEIDIVPVQVKEKFGKLRFYYNIQGNEIGIHALDFLGVGGLRFSQSDTELHKKARDIVRKYEDKSKFVCEVCGCEGELRTDLSWILTLCEKHYIERKNRYKK